ncbi:MAG: SPOR domain-containing protein [Pyrinomonadaceae bacterium]
MTTQEDLHAPAAVEETAPSSAVASPSLEDAPPLLLECEPTLLLDCEPAPFLEAAPQNPPLEATPLPVEVAPVEAAPTPSPKPPARPAAALKVNAPDPFAVGVRLLRMAPAWLLFMTVLCGAFVLALGWVRGDGDASTAGLSRKQNDALSVNTPPKPEAPAPKTAAANSPEIASAQADVPAPAAASIPNQAPPPVEAAPAQPAAPATAPAEQNAAPKPVEPAQPAQPAPADNAGAKFTVQVGSYNNQSEANGHVSRLRAAGFDSRSAAVELPGRGTWYRVQVGRFAERAEASKTVAQLRAQGAASGALVAPLQ